MLEEQHFLLVKCHVVLVEPPEVWVEINNVFISVPVTHSWKDTSRTESVALPTQQVVSYNTCWRQQIIMNINLFVYITHN